MNIIFRTVKLQNLMTSCRDKFVSRFNTVLQAISSSPSLIILFGKMSSSESLSSSGTESETARMTDFKKFGLQPYSLEPTK